MVKNHVMKLVVHSEVTAIAEGLSTNIAGLSLLEVNGLHVDLHIPAHRLTANTANNLSP